LKDLKQITVLGTGLLGGSITLTVMRSFPEVKAVGWSHRESTRQRARDEHIANEIVDDICESVREADIVIAATPICTFEGIFEEIARALPDGCIVTDVGSTKMMPGVWARRKLGANVHYVGSHPIAGSEQRGVEFARDDLFYSAACIITATEQSDGEAVKAMERFWSGLGCYVSFMTPQEHDRVFADISHLPHAMAAALINANDDETLKYAGKGFMDTSRIAGGPANIWSDVFLTNADNMAAGIERVIGELEKLKAAIGEADRSKLEKLLRQAKDKRTKLINYKMKKRELS